MNQPALKSEASIKKMSTEKQYNTERDLIINQTKLNFEDGSSSVGLNTEISLPLM